MNEQRGSACLAALRPLAAAALLLAGCVAGPQAPRSAAPAPLPAVVESVAGEYDTKRQFEAAPVEWRREPVAGYPYDWLDRQHAVFRWVRAPALGEHVLFLEWRRGGPEGPISRQRIWVFERRQGRWVMDFYTLPASPAREVTSLLDADFSALRREQLTGYGSTCSLTATSRGRAVEFSIPEGCSIVARSGRRMRLAAVVRFEDDAVRYREQGVLDDGAIAFLVPGRVGLDYLFERTGSD